MIVEFSFRKEKNLQVIKHLQQPLSLWIKGAVNPLAPEPPMPTKVVVITRKTTRIRRTTIITTETRSIDLSNLSCFQGVCLPVLLCVIQLFHCFILLALLLLLLTSSVQAHTNMEGSQAHTPMLCVRFITVQGILLIRALIVINPSSFQCSQSMPLSVLLMFVNRSGTQIQLLHPS